MQIQRKYYILFVPGSSKIHNSRDPVLIRSLIKIEAHQTTEEEAVNLNLLSVLVNIRPLLNPLHDG